MDIEYDVDDVGALALAHVLANRREVELVGIVVSSGHEWSPLCVDRLNTWYGRPDLPIGFVGGLGSVIMGSKYAREVAHRYPGNWSSAGEMEDSTRLYRRLLAAEDDGAVTLVSIGFMTALHRLLLSPPDDISPLSGADLAAVKIGRWVCMGGGYPSGREYNLIKDGPAAHETFRLWRTPIYFIGEELGKTVMTGAGLRALAEDCPLRTAYELYFDGELRNRPSWDQVAVLFAARGYNDEGGGYWKLVSRGGNRVAADGSNSWDPELDLPHHYLVPALDPALAAQEIEALMMEPPILSSADLLP
ncbi:MAG TPA: hypothetical protein VEA41_04795, partial [Salinarimonas sp.]|nr:hypothetical protein [Salinarimonas sp.]